MKCIKVYFIENKVSDEKRAMKKRREQAGRKNSKTSCRRDQMRDDSEGRKETGGVRKDKYSVVNGSRDSN